MIVTRRLKLSVTNWKLFCVRKHSICFVFEVNGTQLHHANTFQKQYTCLWFNLHMHITRIIFIRVAKDGEDSNTENSTGIREIIEFNITISRYWDLEFNA
jgi:hypothetical protein